MHISNSTNVYSLDCACGLNLNNEVKQYEYIFKAVIFIKYYQCVLIHCEYNLKTVFIRKFIKQ